jgi:hypothetical protein
MVAAFRKSPSVKQWGALILLFGVFSWLLPIALDYYRDFRSIDHAVDVLASDCSQPGGCTLDTRYDTGF